jgi:hypothetical protein
MAGIMSVPKSMQRMRTAVSAKGIWKMANVMNGANSALLDERV